MEAAPSRAVTPHIPLHSTCAAQLAMCTSNNCHQISPSGSTQRAMAFESARCLLAQMRAAGIHPCCHSVPDTVPQGNDVHLSQPKAGLEKRPDFLYVQHRGSEPSSTRLCDQTPRALPLTFAHVGFDFACRLAMCVLAFYAREPLMSERLSSPYHRLTGYECNRLVRQLNTRSTFVGCNKHDHSVLTG